MTVTYCAANHNLMEGFYMFSAFDTLTDILSAPGMKKWFHFLFLEDRLEFFPKELWDQPLRLVAFRGRTPWGSDLQGVADQIVDTANLVLELQAGKRQCLHLHDWNAWEPEEGASLQDAEQTFLITPPVKEEETPLRPALIICPGGGYEFVSFQNEGTPVQMIAERRGYAAFMLRYRVAPSRYPGPQMDLLETIQYVRANAAKYQVDPNRIAVIGFSAGGHLCASVAALYQTLLPEGRPNAVVLGYPVISFARDVTHEGSVLALLGKDEETMRDRLSVENLITPDFPPTFAWACRDDDTVPCENTERLEAKLEEMGVAHECRYYPAGGHGCGLAYDNSAWTWSLDMFSFLERNMQPGSQSAVV